MAKNSTNKGKNKNRTAKDEAIKLTDYLAYMPGLLMVAMIALVLILNIMSPKMQETQYEDFRNIFRVFDYVIITGGLIFLVIAIAKKRLKLCIRDYFFGAFMMCIIISTCINGLSRESAFGIPIRYIGVFNMFAFFIIYMKVSGYIERVSFRHTILMGYLAVADAVALSVIYDKYIGDIPSYLDEGGIHAFFYNSNPYGYFLAMAVMIGIGYYIYEERKRSIFGAFSAVLNLIILVLNNTLGAMLSVGLCTLVTVILVLVNEVKSGKTDEEVSGNKEMTETAKRALALAIFGALTVIIAIFASTAVRTSILVLFRDIGSIIAGNATGAEGSGRWNLWRTVVQYISEKPLFGFGCEGITMRLKEATGMGDAHCEPLTYAAYYGIPGVLLYLAGVAAAAVKYFRHRQILPPYCRVAFLGAAAYFVSSLVGVPVFNTVPFFFIFMGMAAEEWKE